MNDQQSTERRKFARLDLALTVSYAVIDPAGQPIDPREALSTDISAGGLRLMTPTPLEKGAIIDLNIFLAEDEEYRQKMKDFGLKILMPTDAELKAFADAIRKDVWPKLDNYMGKTLVDMCREHVGMEVK